MNDDLRPRPAQLSPDQLNAVQKKEMFFKKRKPKPKPKKLWLHDLYGAGCEAISP